MLNLGDLIQALETFDPEKEVATIIEGHTDKLADLQRDQWMEGRGVDGEYIRPFYSENPYFKSPEAAARYAKWKAKITPNPQRPEDVPNLYINGYLHDSLYAEVVGDTFKIDSDVSFSQDAFEVHKNALGLDEEKRLLFAENITLPEFKEVLKEKTGLTIS